ncbi:MAG: hypothetical protein ABIF77_12855 [bacterium]
MKSINQILFAVLTITVFILGSNSIVQAQVGLFGFEPRLGFVNPEDEIGSTFILAVTGDLGKLADQIKFEGTIDYWNKSYDIVGSTDELSFKNLGFIGCARYDFPTEGSAVPFGFAGLGIHFMSASIGDLSNSEMEMGLQLGGGIDVPMGTNTFVGRAGMDFNGGANYLFLTAGLRFATGG